MVSDPVGATGLCALSSSESKGGPSAYFPSVHILYVDRFMDYKLCFKTEG